MYAFLPGGLTPELCLFWMFSFGAVKKVPWRDFATKAMSRREVRCAVQRAERRLVKAAGANAGSGGLALAAPAAAQAAAAAATVAGSTISAAAGRTAAPGAAFIAALGSGCAVEPAGVSSAVVPSAGCDAVTIFHRQPGGSAGGMGGGGAADGSFLQIVVRGHLDLNGDGCVQVTYATGKTSQMC